MRGNLRFALTALTWAVILLAIYALSARAQMREPLHSAVEAGVGWAAQAGAPGLPVLRGGLKQSSVTGKPPQQQVPALSKAPSEIQEEVCEPKG